MSDNDDDGLFHDRLAEVEAALGTATDHVNYLSKNKERNRRMSDKSHLELETWVGRLEILTQAHRLSTTEIIQQMDKIVAAARLIAVRRVERETVSTHTLLVSARAFNDVEDAGMNVINQVLLQIAKKVTGAKSPTTLGEPEAADE